MRLTFKSESWFPFAVPEKDATFASSVGPQTVYPVGMPLEQVLELYWRAKDFLLVAAGNGTRSGVTQVLSVNQNLAPRDAMVGTNSFFELDGFAPVGPGDFVTGVGLRQVVPGSGTITASGTGGSGTNSAALFNLQMNLFYPEIFAPDPVVKYDGLWWPAMSVSCGVLNPVTLSGGGTLAISFECDSYNPASTTPLGTFSFFGNVITVKCAGLALGETRSFSGAISVVDEWA